MIDQLMPPTANVLQRVLMIRDARTGTAFVTERNERQYVITAAHLLNHEGNSSPRIYFQQNWSNFLLKVLHIDAERDVAVLAFPTYTQRHNTSLSCIGLTLGQQVFFLGFPFEEAIHQEPHFGGSLPLPVVRWSSVAAFESNSYSPNVLSSIIGRMLIQGVAADGFSGGPVVFNLKENEQAICGMVVGTREQSRLAKPFAGAKLEDHLEYVYSADFSLCCTVNSITDAIDRNPIGPKCSKD